MNKPVVGSTCVLLLTLTITRGHVSPANTPEGEALSVPAAARAQSTDPFGPVRDAMQHMVETIGSPSVAVAIAKDGRIVWEHAIGWADREKRIPATVHTIYGLASISKPITATGLMLLAERGRVDLDKPVNDYLGAAKLTGIAGDANGATLRRVLSHTAGLPLHSHFFYSDRGYLPPPMDETIRRYGNLVFPPGETFEYSNLGYGVLSYVIERVSGRSFRDFMRHEVFDPLGLTHTSIDPPQGREDSVAVGYGSDGIFPSFTFDHIGASSAYSSAHDLIRFAMFHLKNRPPGRRPLLSDTSIDAMHSVVPPATDYALGFNVGREPRRLAHGGGMPGGATLMVLYPDENVAVVVLTNTSTREAVFQQSRAIIGAALALVSPRLQLSPPAQAPRGSIATLAGDWRGTIRTYQGTVSLRLLIDANGTAQAWVGDQPGAPVSNVSFANGRFSGNCAATIPTDDAQRWPHQVRIGLLLRDGTLAGQVTANSTADRIYFSLSSYAQLRKQS